VTSTLVFDGNGELNEYVGGYNDWLRQRPDPLKVSAKPALKAEVKTAVKEKAPKKKKLSYKLQRELDELPAKLEAAEERLAELQEETGSGDFYQQSHDVVNQTLEMMQQQEGIVETLMDRWVELEAMQEE
jgi:ATP-binding cassette subfamily F protein uup